jgi:hypothetical protein
MSLPRLIPDKLSKSAGMRKRPGHLSFLRGYREVDRNDAAVVRLSGRVWPKNFFKSVAACPWASHDANASRCRTTRRIRTGNPIPRRPAATDYQRHPSELGTTPVKRRAYSRHLRPKISSMDRCAANLFTALRARLATGISEAEARDVANDLYSR